MIDSLVADLKARRIVLFVGAGVSQQLGLPSWQQLIDQMAAQLGYDPRVFAQHAGYLELAEFYELQTKSIGSLRSWMDRTWHTNEPRVDSSRVHQAIVDLDFPIIYTTNYDRWLEIAYGRRKKKFLKIANVGDFAKAGDGATQIVKLHGDLEDDTSLVLTERSYFERFAFESPLDIKLRSDSIGKGILFVGYSLADVNIRYMLYKLYKLWLSSPYSADRPKSYMFLTRPNPVRESVLSQRGIHPIISDVDDPGVGMIRFFEKLVKEVLGAVP